MTTAYKPKGPWINRFAIWFFTVILGILIFSSLGLLVDDIKAIPGPDFEEIEAQYVSPTLTAQADDLTERILNLEQTITNLEEEQRILTNGSQNLQQTISQLLEVQRLSVEQGIPWSDTDKETLSVSQKRFLENQESYQALNRTLAEQTNEKRTLEKTAATVEKDIEAQRASAQLEYADLRDRHELQLAVLQLVLLIPLSLGGTYLFLKRLSSIYFPLALAFGGATLFRILLVIWDYFPSRWLRYILIISLLLVIGRLLIYFIRSVASPKLQLVIKQFREAYESFLCPVCEYPIRTGPRRYLFWNRKTVKTLAISGDGSLAPEEKYTCPSCGTTLFESCPNCENIRHALLPHCHHCGAEKNL